MCRVTASTPLLAFEITGGTGGGNAVRKNIITSTKKGKIGVLVGCGRYIVARCISKASEDPTAGARHSEEGVNNFNLEVLKQALGGVG